MGGERPFCGPTVRSGFKPQPWMTIVCYHIFDRSHPSLLEARVLTIGNLLCLCDSTRRNEAGGGGANWKPGMPEF
jgi:hypothetical protein|eukprot:COSAG02_NODE_10215_length_1994_cov_1.284433_3_plen_75_part_00